jgi:mono/diheme cytochrome c family protein
MARKRTWHAIMIKFVGKFHLLLVHLPIGCFILLAGLEWLALRPGWKELAPANRVILLLIIPVSALSALCGWLLAFTGDYDADALLVHRWLGTAVPLAAVGLWMVRQRGWMMMYRRGLLVTVLLLGVASHFGGVLTHGKNYLAWPGARSADAKPLSEAELLAQPVYPTLVQPIFNQYCVSCHGPEKAKGGLRLDSVEHLRRGGDSGAVIESAATPSLLGQRLQLPTDDEDHMPPAGKPQLSAAQLATVLWWLNSGAPTDQTPVAKLNPTPEQVLHLRTARAETK